MPCEISFSAVTTVQMIDSAMWRIHVRMKPSAQYGRRRKLIHCGPAYWGDASCIKAVVYSISGINVAKDTKNSQRISVNSIAIIKQIKCIRISFRLPEPRTPKGNTPDPINSENKTGIEGLRSKKTEAV